MADLKGKAIAMHSEGSAAGHVGVSELIVEAGLNLQTDFTPVMLGREGLTALQNGEVEAWGTASTLRDRYFAEDNVSVADFSITAQGEKLPNDIFLGNATLASDCIEGLKTTLIEHHEDVLSGLLATQANAKYCESEVVEAYDSDYDSLHEIFRLIDPDNHF